MHKLRNWLAGSDLAAVVVLAVIVLAVMPLTLDIFRLNLVGKYLTYGFVPVGLVMLWGYGGILSLGQGVFFGLGGYCMAMFLKLEASDPQSTRIQSTPGIPDFMDWNQLTALPLWWEPFRYLPFALDVADRLFVIEGGRLVHEAARANIDADRIKQYLSV